MPPLPFRLHDERSGPPYLGKLYNGGFRHAEMVQPPSTRTPADCLLSPLFPIEPRPTGSRRAEVFPCSAVWPRFGLARNSLVSGKELGLSLDRGAVVGSIRAACATSAVGACILDSIACRRPPRGAVGPVTTPVLFLTDGMLALRDFRLRLACSSGHRNEVVPRGHRGGTRDSGRFSPLPPCVTAAFHPASASGGLPTTQTTVAYGQ